MHLRLPAVGLTGRLTLIALGASAVVAIDAPCNRAVSEVLGPWVSRHKPRGVDGTWISPFSTEAWWDSNNGNSKRQEDSSFTCPGGDKCLRDLGRLCCYSESDGTCIYNDGYTLDLITGDYTTSDGQSGNVQFGPCPGDAYEKEEDGRRCRPVPVRSPTDSSGPEASDTAAQDDDDNDDGGDGASDDDEPDEGVIPAPAALLLAFGVGFGLLNAVI